MILLVRLMKLILCQGTFCPIIFILLVTSSIFADERLQELINLLKNDKSFKVRAQSALALGKIGSPSALKPLIDALDDENYIVRGSAAKALGELGESSSFRELSKVLKDPNNFVSKYAREAIRKILKSAELIFIDLRKIYSSLDEQTDLTGKLYQESLLLQILNHSKFVVGEMFDFRENGVEEEREIQIMVELNGNIENLEIDFYKGSAFCEATLSLVTKNKGVIFPSNTYRGKIKDENREERNLIEKVIYKTGKIAFDDLYKTVFE